MASLSILIIDKNRETSKMLTDFVAKHGYQAQITTTGNEGLDFIESNKPTIVILCDTLADMNAHDFIVKASQRKVMSHSTYVYNTSAILNEIDKIKLMTLGFSYFLSANFDEESKKNLEWIFKEEQKLMAA
jgi:DNA-binding response OmpR family regulator